jgi:hypothetical protein
MKGVQIAMTKKQKKKVSNATPLEIKRGTPSLRFTPTAWAKLLFLRDYGDTEVGGFGITASDDLLLIEDVQLVQQVCSWAQVLMDDESVADFFDQQVDAGRRPEEFARVWVHTHPGDCPQPSMTDEETFDRVFGRSDWAVMFILAREGRSCARLRFNVGPRADLELPIGVDYSSHFGACDFDAWEQEYLANVRAQESIQGVPSAWEPACELPFHEEPDSEWYENWADYAEEGESNKHVKGFVS